MKVLILGEGKEQMLYLWFMEKLFVSEEVFLWEV